MTKQIPRTEFKKHCDYIYWRPDFSLKTDNRLDESYMVWLDTFIYFSLIDILVKTLEEVGYYITVI